MINSTPPLEISALEASGGSSSVVEASLSVIVVAPVVARSTTLTTVSLVEIGVVAGTSPRVVYAVSPAVVIVRVVLPLGAGTASPPASSHTTVQVPSAFSVTESAVGLVPVTERPSGTVSVTVIEPLSVTYSLVSTSSVQVLDSPWPSVSGPTVLWIETSSAMTTSVSSSL